MKPEHGKFVKTKPYRMGSQDTQLTQYFNQSNDKMQYGFNKRDSELPYLSQSDQNGQFLASSTNHYKQPSTMAQSYQMPGGTYPVSRGSMQAEPQFD